ncbi:MAG: SUMF1/EgtB/PvdO family nonheme iron enzyme, partial [Bacteroidales bacterium]
GSSSNLTSGDGGSGVVIIRYQIPGITTKSYGIANAGNNNESINSNYANSLGNAFHSSNSTNLSGPARVGIFATNNSNRKQSGASYYGVMELSGNLWEQAIPVNQTYDGSHGDGTLSTPTNWTTMGKRGGAWNTPIERLRVSDRDQATTPSGRNAATGFRAVRTAP